MIKIPLDLKNKLCNMEGTLNQKQDMIDVTSFDDIITKMIPNRISTELELELNDINSINACNQWMTEMCKIDIGSYIGIMPINIQTHNSTAEVTFYISDIDLNGGNWKDWFVVGDTEYDYK